MIQIVIIRKWSKLTEIMHSVGWNRTQRELQYSIFANRGTIVYPGRSAALGKGYARTQWKILTYFDEETYDDETTFTMNKARKHQFSGYCITNRQKWVNMTTIQSVAAAKNIETLCQKEWFRRQIWSLNKHKICIISFYDAIYRYRMTWFEIFSRGHATLHLALSVSRSVGR